ncbi:MAG: hypothetical protein WC516_05820 [Patescibacteria group bacterium]|jgi:hypothetical protein
MESEIRKLARSMSYQNLYNASKECSNIQLVDNVSNFSGLQMSLMYWVATYSILYQELATCEDKYLTEKVIQDDVRCDAYLIHRKKKHDHFWKERRKEETMDEIRHKHPTKHQSGKTSLIETQFYIEEKGNKND